VLGRSGIPDPLRRLSAPLRSLFCLLAILVIAGSSLPAQNASGPAPLTEADVAARLKRWSAPSFDPALQKLLVPLAGEAASHLQQAASSQKQAASFQDQITNLPKKAEDMRRAATRPVPAPPGTTEPPDNASADDLEVALSRLRTAIEQARREVVAARSLPQQATARRKELSAAETDLSARLLKYNAEPPRPIAGEAPELTEARSMAHRTAMTAAEAQLRATEAELAWLDAAGTTNLGALTLDEAVRRLNAWEEMETALTKRIDDARTRTATNSLQAAARNQAEAPAALQPALEKVTQRAAENQDIVENRIPEAEARLRELEAETRKWLETSQLTRQKIRRLGTSGFVGVELRQQRQSLPSRTQLQLGTSQRQEKINAVELARLRLEEELAALPLPEERATSAESRAASAQRESLNALLQNYNRYFYALVRVEEAAQQLSGVVTAHRSFIHENILWLPSTLPAGLSSLTSLGQSLRWLAGGLTDPELYRIWWQGLRRAPVTFSLGLLLLAFLFAARRFGRRRLGALARIAAQPDPGFRPTAAAVVWTAVMALPWPAAIWLFATPWLESPGSSTLEIAWAASLQFTGAILLAIELMRQPLRPDGLAAAHFGWPEGLVRELRWKFRRMLAVFIPCALFGLTFRLSDEVRHDPGERLCLAIALLFSAWWLHRLWHIGRQHAGLPPRGLGRLAWFAGHALSVLVPIALTVLALRGYLYTAESLTKCLGLSLLAGGGFLGARALFFRWYELHRHQLRTARAKQLREAREAARAAALAAAEGSGNTPAGTGTSELPPEAPAETITGPDIDENGQEMRSLVDIIIFIAAVAVAWTIWADVLPAARTLASYPLESMTSLLPDAAKPADSDKPTGTPSASLPLPGISALPSTGLEDSTTPARRANWFSALLALAAGTLTLMAARRIPGALQFVLTSHLTLDAGARFALSTITRYVILIAGIVFTLGLLGITWSSVQWLAAALTVGLGFGLQEIFANFFSGLIILAERPIRLGDIVTIDNITGTVSRIQIRATTIRAGDGKDYVVPNKEFITGKLLNWTLTDTTTRQEIPVGIAYGSDPTVALAILAKVASEHPAVLKDPPPVVSFELFGESAMNLRLRFHVNALDERMPTLTDLNCAIAREFAAAGIQIPYPQRDLHLRSVPEGFLTAPKA
jgi:potassium-dependent mechanosensitive channel